MPDPDNAVVLVADSEVSVVKNVSSILGKAGFTVLTAHGAPGVLELCERHSKQIDLAIIDTEIPADSAAVLDRLYDSYPSIRILYTSAKDDSGAVARPGRVRNFLQKPFRRSKLLGRVLQVLDAPMVRTA